MNDSTTPEDARRAVDELEEKIVDDPEKKGSSPAKEPDTGDAAQATPGTEEPPD